MFALIEWAGSLSDNAASLLGQMLGSFFGLIAILVGALFNARLNRKRDDRIRKWETASIVTALKAELVGLRSALKGNAERLSVPKGKGFLTPDLAHSVRVLPTLLPKLGLLDVETIQEVITAYVLIEQYAESLLLMGGEIQKDMPASRRLIYMPAHRANDVADMNLNMAKSIQSAIVKLEK